MKFGRAFDPAADSPRGGPGLTIPSASLGKVLPPRSQRNQEPEKLRKMRRFCHLYANILWLTINWGNVAKP